jgi:epoxyqueuosine reductase QueG
MEQTIREEIQRVVASSQDNRFPGSDEPYFDEPLVGYAAAGDPLFAEYRQIIGAFHQTPAEVLAAACGAVTAATVICWILPISRPIRESNRREEQWPSREWALTRSNGDAFNTVLRRHLVAWLQAAGYHAVAPQLAPTWQQLADTPVGQASTWSERHAAYAAGLGTFSLNDGLITAKGIAHRCGSVITDLSLAPTPRTAADHRSNCLYYRDGSCGACIKRCPAGALSRQGHDKKACLGYVYGTVPAAVGKEYGVPHTGCGLCQTRVPCEAQIPGPQ